MYNQLQDNSKLIFLFLTTLTTYPWLILFLILAPFMLGLATGLVILGAIFQTNEDEVAAARRWCEVDI